MKNLLAALLCVLSFISFTSITHAKDGPTTRPTLWLIGDSTVNNNGKGEKGWGNVIAEQFDTTKIKVENKARGGRSSRTYIAEGLWDEVLKNIQPGDFVFVQFGHNDYGALDGDKPRGSLKGTGEETKEVSLKDDKKETVHTFGWYMRKYVNDSKAKGASVILFSPVPHCPVKNGKNESDRKGPWYGDWSKEVAKSENAQFVDLFAITFAKYEKMTPEEIKTKFFTDADNTHTSPAGAEMNAKSVTEGIRQLDKCEVVKYLLPEVK